MSEPILVTSALPYANGSIHLGHLLEYIMTDTYVRALRMAGEDVAYICADDTHGTPIEVNAQKAGVPPEEFIKRFAVEHLEDFAAFEVSFDHFDSTNSEENRRWANEIYAQLKAGGYVTKKTITQLYDEKASRFLPDRFVKGECPRCGTKDQYGDVCESCGATYEPTDLKNPYSVVSGTKPVLKESEHLFVDLAAFVPFLREWVSTPGRLQQETRRFVEAWIEGGLKDWCISRDAPYFGFEIPGEPGKYFYVWLDAPIGYISSTERWNEQKADQIWRKGKGRIEHVIGKDIVYFHTLFWPAMLHAAKLSVPAKVQVHGMLTVDGVKMSKSRGTFINGRTFRAHLEPATLRYYYASKIGPKPEDVDLSTNEFVQRVNAELVNTFANLVARGAPFLKRYGQLGPEAKEHLAFTEAKVKQAVEAYRGFDLAGAVRAALDIATLANKLFQDFQPWKRQHTDPDATNNLVTLCLNMARSATVLIAPAVPSFAAKVYPILGLEGVPRSFAEATAFDLVDRPLGTPGRIFERITAKQLEAVIEASKPPSEKAADASEKQTQEVEPVKAPAAQTVEIVPSGSATIDDFMKLDLRVGLVVKAEIAPRSDKLLQLSIDLGEGRPRNIFAGIRAAYAPEELVGKRVVVVANLPPRKMAGGVSEGMVLAAGPGGKDVWVLSAPDAAPPGSKVK